MNLLKEIFILRNISLIAVFVSTAIFGNLSYAFVMTGVSDGQSVLNGAVGRFSAAVSPSLLLFAIVIYGLSFLTSFYLQVYLANKFSVDLNIDMDQYIGIPVLKEDSSISQALVIKDISNEFARFGNNIILPLTEIIKNLVSLLIILMALFFVEPTLLFPIILFFLFYSGFWALTKNFFVKIAKNISELLLERQRLAEFKYQNYNELTSKSESSKVQLKYEAALFAIAKLNVISKTIAIMPRVFIETILLAVIIYYIFLIGENSIILLGLAGIRLLVATQAISNGVSNLQLNWPALKEYELRRNTYVDFHEATVFARDYPFPKIVPAGKYSVNSLKVDFVVTEDIDIRKANIVLLRGASGIGKSTFLNCICGFHTASFETESFISPGHSDVSFLGQNTQIMTGTVMENISLNSNNEWDETEAMELYSVMFGFGSSSVKEQKEEFHVFLNRDVGLNSGISGGEAKRVRLMSSLLSGADFFIWDEPFDGINPLRVEQIVTYLQTVKNKTFMVIDHGMLFGDMATHTLNFEQNEHGVVFIRVDN